MSTQCMIAIEQGYGSIRSVSRSKDGGLVYTGGRLHNLYDTEGKALTLFEDLEDVESYPGLVDFLEAAFESYATFAYVWTLAGEWMVYEGPDFDIDEGYELAKAFKK